MSGSQKITLEDVRRLPRWARVAFAARCGRRAQALFRQLMPKVSSKFLDAFDRAVTLAEQSSANAEACDGLEEAAATAERLASQAIGIAPIRASSPTAGKSLTTARKVRYAFAKTAAAAARAALNAGRANDEASVQAAFQAYDEAAYEARLAGAPDLGAVIEYDYKLLEQAAEQGLVTDEAPVEPQFFGLEKEVETYRRELPKLLTDEGKFVLIQGDQVSGIFGTRDKALQAGYGNFGFSSPFLVKQIQAEEKPVYLRYDVRNKWSR